MNYIGSKLSLIDFLQNSIDNVVDYSVNDEYTFADLFAGTGIVGATFKQRNCKILSNDIQYYSYIINKHLIENMPPIDFKLVDYLDSLNGVEGFVYNNYCEGSGSGRNYFSDYNGKKCDAIRIEIETLYKNKKIDKQQYFYFLASLINSIDKFANTASVYGAFLKKIKKSANNQLKFELLPIINGNNNGKVFNEDINQLIKKIKGEVLYLDPPYNARQYCSNYHVLESIAKYNNPILYGKTGLPDYSKQKSLFCSKKEVANVFNDLIKNANFKYIFLSYNNEGLMSVDTIREIMKQYGKYELFTTEYHRFKADKDNNRNIKGNKTIEYLHCLIK